MSLPQGRASKLLMAAVRRQLPSVGLPVQTLQPSVTEDRLGMTIIGVTLEAVTPPPEAASAFAAVADAASERERKINETQGKAAQSLSLARAQADEDRSRANASATEQMEQAKSSAASFVALSEEARRARAARFG